MSIILIYPASAALIALALILAGTWIARRKGSRTAQQGLLSSARQAAQNNWGWILTSVIVVGVGILLWVTLPDYLKGSMFFWAIVLFVVATFIPKLTGAEWHSNAFRAVGALLLLVVIADSAVGDWFGRTYQTVARGLSDGNWSAPADHLPTYSGGTMYLDSGEQRTIMLAGRIRVPNPICNKINADPEVVMREDLSSKNIYLEPWPEMEQQRTTVTAIRSYDTHACRQYWNERSSSRSELRLVNRSF